MNSSEITHLLIGAPPWLITVALAFYALAQTATLLLQVFQFITSKFNSKEIVETKNEIVETKKKTREINHTLNEVSQKVDAVGVIVKNGH